MRCVRIPYGTAIALSLAVGLVLVGGAALAKDEADPESYRALDIGGGLVTIDVQDAPFGQVVEQRIQPRTRVNIIVAKEAAAEPVTLKVIDLHWVQTLDAMTDRIGAVMVRKGPNLLSIERPKPITISFKDTDISEVIQGIAKYADANVIVSPKVQGKITLSVTDMPWRAALDYVVKAMADYAVVEHDYGALLVLPKDELELEEDYYRFRFLRPPAPYKGVMATSGAGGGSGGSGGGTSGGTNAGDIYVGEPTVPTDDITAIEEHFPIIGALRQIVEPDQGTVKYMPEENLIIYTGTKPRIQRLKRMVETLDVEPPQVFIDMNFIVTSNSDSLDLGLRAGDTSGVRFGAQGSNILTMLPFNVGGGNGIAEALTGTAFASPAASAFTYGTLTTSETTLLWNFLQRDNSTRIVQAPKLLALDNQAATIFIGETIRYARTTAATNQNGGLQFSVEEDPNSPVNVGFQLLVIPHVIPGEQKIRMTVIPQRRALTGTGPLPGFDRITVSGQSIDLPRVQSSTLVTHMILRDNQTAVIGGLLEDREVKRVDKIPFLGDLPLVGLLFQGKGSTKVKEHLLITITPRILRGTDAVNCTITDELSGRSQRVAAEYKDLYGETVKWPGQDGGGGAVAVPADLPPPTVAPGG